MTQLTAPGGGDSARAYPALAASHLESRRSGANRLLMWEALKTAAESVSSFDMRGADIGAIAALEGRFGGVPAPYFEYRFAKNAILYRAANAFPCVRRTLKLR